jgi:hypothetical protein
MTGALARLHNPRNYRCTCATDCWCQRTRVRRLFRWYFPWFHTIPPDQRGWEPR